MSFLLRPTLAAGFELGGQAIDGIGDTHLTKGIHVRLAQAPQLGLPSQPFEVLRLSHGPGSQWPGVRDDITWIDADGEELTTPFTLTPNSPVRGYPTRLGGAMCCWIRVERKKTGPVFPDLPMFPTDPPVLAPLNPNRRSRNPNRRSRRRGFSRRGLTSSVVVTSATTASLGPFVPTFTGSLLVRAFTNTQMGPAVVATRSASPFELAATPIEWIELWGSAEITGVRWLDASELVDEAIRRINLPDSEPDHLVRWRTLSLPVEDALRYQGAPPDAVDHANARAEEGAPLRFGLHDDPSVAGPSASPPATPPDERARLDELTPQLGEFLQKLVSAQSPGALVEPIDVPPPANSQFEIGLQDSVLQALIDPGIARWMGYAVTDREPPTDTPGDLVAYAVASRWGISSPGGLADFTRRLGTVVCAVVGHPGNLPDPLLLDPPESGSFLPTDPPDARRIVRLGLHHVVIGGALAWGRRQGAAVTGLNPRSPAGRAAVLAPNVPDDAQFFGDAKLTDRSAPAEAFVYRVSQHDWFGRWTDWAERAAPAADRPRPPVPIVHADYTPPEVTEPIPTGLLSGTLSIEIPVPPVASLSPGAHLLDHVALTVDGAAHILALADPSDPERDLTAEIDGPDLQRAGEQTVTIVARWIDQGGLVSDPSAPRTLTLRDPRPAPPIAFPPGLRYTSRPDVTGRARFRLQWQSGLGHAFFRVFYTDEVRLRDGLEALIASGGPSASRAAGVLAAVNAADAAPERAEVFENAADLFIRDQFELLSAKPIAAGAPGTSHSFDHEVSGALTVLSFYRVVSVTGAQVEAPFTSAGLLPVRVPNTLAAPRPTLTVKPTIDPLSGDFEAKLEVTVPLGAVPANQFRIRRAVEGASELVGMPVIETGSLSPTPEGRQKATRQDSGLGPWVRYIWRAEVRGPSEPGRGPGADWSPPSAPVAFMFAPPEPPAPPVIVGVDTSSTETIVRITHPDNLDASVGRGYEIDIYRQLPGERAKRAETIDGSASPEDGGLDSSGEYRFLDSGQAIAGTGYRVVVRDPLGRPSAASEVFVVAGDP